MSQGIFEGLKVIDCASFIAAPSSATALSDFGADVIKIEPPGAGDPVRNLPNLPGYPISNHNYAWMLEGRNKKSLALDLSKPEGQAVLRKLAAEADVFITNFPPPVRKKLGVTWKDLAPLNDRLIYASFTGYGETGAEADKPGFDSNAWWARSGLMDLVRETNDTVPARSMPGMGDHPCAMSLFAGIVTALYQREKTGKGTQVMSNLMVNGIWSNGIYAQAALCGAKFQERPPRDCRTGATGRPIASESGRRRSHVKSPFGNRTLDPEKEPQPDHAARQKGVLGWHQGFRSLIARQRNFLFLLFSDGSSRWRLSRG